MERRSALELRAALILGLLAAPAAADTILITGVNCGLGQYDRTQAPW